MARQALMVVACALLLGCEGAAAVASNGSGLAGKAETTDPVFTGGSSATLPQGGTSAGAGGQVARASGGTATGGTESIHDAGPETSTADGYEDPGPIGECWVYCDPENLGVRCDPLCLTEQGCKARFRDGGINGVWYDAGIGCWCGNGVIATIPGTCG